MVDDDKNRDPIPEHFETLEAAGDFWDTHDLVDYWDQTEEVEFTVDLCGRHYLIALEPDLARRLAAEAKRRGISTETLTNLWLNQQLQQTTS